MIVRRPALARLVSKGDVVASLPNRGQETTHRSDRVGFFSSRCFSQSLASSIPPLEPHLDAPVRGKEMYRTESYFLFIFAIRFLFIFAIRFCRCGTHFLLHGFFQNSRVNATHTYLKSMQFCEIPNLTSFGLDVTASGTTGLSMQHDNIQDPPYLALVT
ncbi:uncharacterized protein LOC120692853 isoform X2 [Panicum virgatum]|uniref:uncharacterized protein LOC120692853 isoform X2 n=1 Tax=Panicum virgatum TaxID=38727 RepID=UPI0019D52DC3|nr:uncharacterized protein LOC120692853 isoform X2 [Panicum virgatum]